MSRSVPSLLHVDLDAFYAAVEQRDKPSLRGRPVVVGGTGGRGVVATASYEARAFGVHSAMPVAQARARCPNAAYLVPRFAAYAEASAVVMGLLRDLSPLVEPLSLDEAFVDLEASSPVPPDAEAVRVVAEALRDAVTARTGLTLSIGAASTKLVAKIASDLDKPRGLRVVPVGGEVELLHSLGVTRIPGVGPATAQRLARQGLRTIAELAAVEEPELVRLLGQAHGRGLWRLARNLDDRRVEPERESKSVSSEDTFARDVADPTELRRLLDGLARRTVRRLRTDSLSGRTVTVKVRLGDFTTLSRSSTLLAPTDDEATVVALARRLLGEVDTTGGVRLLGVGVSNLADWSQEALFGDDDPGAATVDASTPAAVVAVEAPPLRPGTAPPQWRPGQDVRHREHGDGWVWGSGLGVVTVRFETRHTPPGRVRSLRWDDPDLTEREIGAATGQPVAPTERQ